MIGRVIRRAHLGLEAARRPAWWAVLAGAFVLSAADIAQRAIGGDGAGAGATDELAHLMTGFLVLAAVCRGSSRWFAAGLLVGSLAIDADHIPQYLGDDFLTVGTQRPYTHSLITLGVLVAVAVVARGRWRLLVLGLGLGVAAHFGRDLTESRAGVPLLWPRSYQSFTAPHWIYLIAMSVLAVAALVRAVSGADRSRAEFGAQVGELGAQRDDRGLEFGDAVGERGQLGGRGGRLGRPLSEPDRVGDRGG